MDRGPLIHHSLENLKLCHIAVKMRIYKLLVGTILTMTFCVVQSQVGMAGLGGIGGLIGFGAIKLLKLKLAALVVASLLKKFQGGMTGGSHGGGGNYGGGGYGMGGGGGGYGGIGGGSYGGGGNYGGAGGNYVGGGGGYRKRSVGDGSRRDDGDLRGSLKKMYEALAVNDDSFCIPRVVCEVNVAQGRNYSSSLEAELLRLFRDFDPKINFQSSAYQYRKSIRLALDQKDSNECIRAFASCKVPSVELLQVIGRLMPTNGPIAMSVPKN